MTSPIEINNYCIVNTAGLPPILRQIPCRLTSEELLRFRQEMSLLYV
jgi:hypothetical protein